MEAAGGEGERTKFGAVMMRVTQKAKAGLGQKLSYAAKWMPRYVWQRFTRRLPRTGHVIVALADHFEPSITATPGEFAEYHEQERRIEKWCREYPRQMGEFRDSEGHALLHTYFYPAEQYDRAHLEELAEHCSAGWGEIEIHLHHGMNAPDSAENTRRVLEEFRDRLAREHGALSYEAGSSGPRYAFVHGNFALANSDGGRNCGVDAEMQILSDTGCYADMTLPTAPWHGAQIAKINSIYECGAPLTTRLSQGRGRNLTVGRRPQILPLVVQGPLLADFGGTKAIAIDNGALTGRNPATLRRFAKWKRSAISVEGRPDWIFVKLHCHGMDPRDDQAMLGEPMRNFLRELTGAAGERGETLHFTTAREMVNIILAACDGREGNPGEYRDYRFRRGQPAADSQARTLEAEVRG